MIALASPQLLTLTVLVVDDNDAVRHIMARKLEQEGYHVLTAADGEQALTLIEQSGIEVDLVICDLLMPRLDGYQLASRLAELPNAPEVIFITAFRSDVELVRGPTLTKPFHLDDLTTVVQRILQKRIDTREDHAEVNQDIPTLTQPCGGLGVQGVGLTREV